MSSLYLPFPPTKSPIYEPLTSPDRCLAHGTPEATLISDFPIESYEGPKISETRLPFAVEFLDYTSDDLGKWIRRLVYALNDCHRRIVVPSPVPHTPLGTQLERLALHAILGPVLTVFNQLRELSLPPLSYRCGSHLDGAALEIHFSASSTDDEECLKESQAPRRRFTDGDNGSDTSLPPMRHLLLPCLVVVAPGSLRSGDWSRTSLTRGWSGTTATIVDLLTHLNHRVPDQHIVVTDFSDVVVLWPNDWPGPVTGEASFDRIYLSSTSRPSIPIILASFIFAAGSRNYLYKNAGNPFAYHGALTSQDHLLLSTVVNKESRPAEEVYRTARGIEDLDLYAASTVPVRLHHLLQWKQAQAKAARLRPWRVGDTLAVKANTFVRENTLYPIHAHHCPLPLSTREYLQASRRRRISQSFEHALAHCEEFTVRIETLVVPSEEPLQPPLGDGLELVPRVANCVITAIDGQATCHAWQKEQLCLKLFDDRLMEPAVPENPDEEWLEAMTVPAFDTATSLIQTAMAALENFRDVQGCICPYAYGVHTITLPDGWKVYGMLSEWVSGCRLDRLGPAEKAASDSVIHSARQVLRVCQRFDAPMIPFSDVNMLVHRRADGDPIFDCVLVDLTPFRISDSAYNYQRGDDYDQFRRAVRSGLGMREDEAKAKWTSAGLRENWDTYGG